jgi:FkbM family methyltransferase
VSWTSDLRLAAFERLPKAWRPVAHFHYYRARALLERELSVVCRDLTPGSRVVDVGAHEGVYTHAFARTGALVEAFEPQPPCLEVLRSYERRHANVRVHGDALGAEAGWATLRVPRRDGRAVSGRARLDGAAAGDGEGGPEYRVRVRPLDSFAFGEVALIKIDVEGRELDVLRGARDTLARCRPMLLVEIEQRHLPHPIGDAFAELDALGYTGEFLDPSGRLRPIGEFDTETYQQAANADRPRAPYVNNFLFRPRAGRNA